MPVKIGNTSYKDIYVGNTSISKIYTGNNLVYNKGGGGGFITNGLVAYFKFNNNYNNEAGLLALTTPTIPTQFSLNTFSKHGGKSLYNNNGAYAYNPSLYDVSYNSFSISAWVCPTATSSYYDPTTSTGRISGFRFFIVNAHGGAGGRVGIGLSIATNAIMVSARKQNTHYCIYSATATIPNDVFSHIVLVCNNKVFTVYLNGVAITGSQVTWPENYAMGFGFGGTYGNYVGYGDEVAQYNRALSVEEVTTLYNNGDGLFYNYV